MLLTNPRLQTMRRHHLHPPSDTVPEVIFKNGPNAADACADLRDISPTPATTREHIGAKTCMEQSPPPPMRVGQVVSCTTLRDMSILVGAREP